MFCWPYFPGKSLIEVHKRFKDGIPLLDPIQDMKITEPAFAALVKVALFIVVFMFCYLCLVFNHITLFVHVIDSQDMERFEARLLRHPLFSSSNLKVRRFAVVLTNLTNPIVFVL